MHCKMPKNNLKNIGLGPWGSWSSCKDVGKGPEKQKRERKCTEGICSGVTTDTKDCSSWGTGDFSDLVLTLLILSNNLKFGD